MCCLICISVIENSTSIFGSEHMSESVMSCDKVKLTALAPEWSYSEGEHCLVSPLFIHFHYFHIKAWPHDRENHMKSSI